MASGFEHLNLILRHAGPARFPPGPPRQDPRTAANRRNRRRHSDALGTSATAALAYWAARQAARGEAPGLGDGAAFLIQIDPSLDLDVLRSTFEFEIIVEEEDGYVIVASEDLSLEHFQKKLADFVEEARGSAEVARILKLDDDPTQDERLRRILSERLYQEWATMPDATEHIVDVGVTCLGTLELRKKPKRNPRWSDAVWARKELEWSSERNQAYEQWDSLRLEREDMVESLVSFYGGQVLLNVDNQAADSVSLPDSFTMRIRIVGQGLRDLMLNCPYVFEVIEPDDIELPQLIARELAQMEAELDLIAPHDGAPAVCVIDSGIQQEHRLLSPAVDRDSSHCFLPGSSPSDVADYVRPGGHGTRVAGAVLYGESIPRSGRVDLQTWIQNARILDSNCDLPKELMPPAALRAVILRYRATTRIFNHSINARTPCRTVHMSAWAAEIDRLSLEEDVLIIQSAGNIPAANPVPNPGVQEHLSSGRVYPDYLQQNACRIANPAQSLQALTVGSVAYGSFTDGPWRSLADRKGAVSSFSRVGPGIWGVNKPEVVEYGGDYLVTTGRNPSVGWPGCGRSCYPELVRSTLHSPGPALDRDEPGTSYAAPKVARIAAAVQAVLPDQPTLLYRALLVQSARWPVWGASLPPAKQTQLFRQIGYGLPDLERATTNTEYRVTYITDGVVGITPGSCDIYQIAIPDSLRRPGDEFDVRIDVTLSYAAAPRRTRRNLRRYLSVWADWRSNRLGESLEAFLSRLLKEEEDVIQEGAGFGWTLEANPRWGKVPDVSRGAGTVCKDWATVKSHQLPENLCIAVRGHKGWSLDPEATASYTMAVTIEVTGQEIPIYETLQVANLELQAEIEAVERIELRIQ